MSDQTSGDVVGVGRHGDDIVVEFQLTGLADQRPSMNDLTAAVRNAVRDVLDRQEQNLRAGRHQMPAHDETTAGAGTERQPTLEGPRKEAP